MIAYMLAFLGGLGWQEILVILLVILILFGGRKLPELARGLGRGLREFKKELKGVKKDVEEEPETPSGPEEGKEDPHAAGRQEEQPKDSDKTGSNNRPTA